MVLEWRNSSRKNEEAEQKRKKCPVVEGTGDGSKVRCCKEQHSIGTWNVRTMNQGKLKVVKKEMVRVNIDILGISELKCTGISSVQSLNRIQFFVTSNCSTPGFPVHHQLPEPTQTQFH